MGAPGLWQWLAVFIVGTALLAVAGTVLARAADRLAEETGLGRLAVGAVLLAAATSLPEALAVVSAALVGSSDLVVSGVLGSSMANMAILAVLDLVHRRRVWVRVEMVHARIAAVAIALTALALAGLIEPGLPAIGPVGLDTILIAASYGAGIAWLQRTPRRQRIQPLPGVPAPPLPRDPPRRRPTSPTVRSFGLATAGVLVAAPGVARSAEGIVATSGLDAGFVGVAFLAVATSLPELVTSLAAVRLRAYDLAVANLFGSNLFNVTLLVVADVVTPAGPLLRNAGADQVLPGAAAILLMAVALAALVSGEETRIRNLEPDAALLLLLYGAAVVLIGA